jgi:phosphomannomutase
MLPTPGVAALAPRLGAAVAGVVSASHNPYPDNGIKFLSGEGRKLPDARERELERLAGEDFERPTGSDVGAVKQILDASGLYAETVLSRLRPPAEGMRVLLDCANGAAYKVAPLAFGELGDGLLTALALLDVMARSGKPLSELGRVMDQYPQTLVNVRVEDWAVADAVEVREAVARAERRLGSEGRILLRPSGTEPLVRVMVEHVDGSVCREVCAEIAEVVASSSEVGVS